MIDVIVGKKGSGKTAILVEKINEKASVNDSTIVCVAHSRHLDNQIPHEIRLVEITDYPISGPEEFLAFLYGMSSRDYDISHIYLDNILKIFLNRNYEHYSYEEAVSKINSFDLVKFFEDLDVYSEKTECDVTVTLSIEKEDLPKEISKYM